MSTTNLRFQTFTTRLRPHRVAILTDINDANWQYTCLRIIEYQSQIWGGNHSIIIPTDGETIEPVFWEIISSFDPDIICRYQKSGHDWLKEQPEEFEKYVDAHVAAAIKDGINLESTEKMRDQFLKTPLDNGIQVSENLNRQFLIRLSPFHFEGSLQIYSFGAYDSPYYPLTHVADIIDCLGVAPDYVFDVANDAPPTLALPPKPWLFAESGIVSKSFQERLDAKNVKTVSKSLYNATEFDLVQMGMKPWSAFGENAAFALSRIGLTGVRSTSSRRYALQSVIIVGETLQDFCLYLALSKIHGRALWAPDWLLPVGDESPGRLTTAVRTMQDIARRDHSQTFSVVSLSRGTDKLNELVLLLQKYITMSSFASEDAKDHEFVRTLVEHPMIWYVTKNIERITTHQLVNDQLPGPFESPVPIVFTQIHPQHHRWLIEITFSEHMTPRHPALGAKLGFGPNVGEVRAATNGLTFCCPGAAVFNSDMELQILRPSITVPSAENIFQIAFKNFGYETRISDKGAYAQSSIEKFGGLSEIATALRHPQLISLFNKFRDIENRPAEGVHNEGYLLRDKRRYLNFACILKLLSDPIFAYRTVDEYIEKGILYRGLVLHCKRCADVSWFSIGEINQTFTCRRCGTNQQYGHASWHHGDEPSWYYKLDEIVHQMLSHDGAVGILTLDSMRKKHLNSFLYAPELAIKPEGADKWEMEIDICCIAGGQMFIGEAKSTASLKSDQKSPHKVANRYRHFATELGATGVIFSTSEGQWDDTSKQAIETQFLDHPFLRVKRMTAADL